LVVFVYIKLEEQRRSTSLEMDGMLKMPCSSSGVAAEENSFESIDHETQEARQVC
jgi:hypothetical protein